MTYMLVALAGVIGLIVGFCWGFGVGVGPEIPGIDRPYRSAEE